MTLYIRQFYSISYYIQPQNSKDGSTLYPNPVYNQHSTQTQSTIYSQCHRPSVTLTSIKILHKNTHTHVHISTNMLSENRKERKTFLGRSSITPN